MWLSAVFAEVPDASSSSNARFDALQSLIDGRKAMLLIIEKCLGLLFGNLVLDEQIVVMPSTLILLCLQIVDKLRFLHCQRTTALTRIVNLFAGQNGYDCVFLIFLRQGAHTDIALLPWMAECDILPAGDDISGLLHKGKEPIKVMRLFCQSLINIKAESIAVGELFNISLPAVIAHAVRLRIFNHRHSVLNTDQVTKPPNCYRAAQEISKFAGAVQRGGIPIDVIMDMMLVCVGTNDKGMIAF